MRWRHHESTTPARSVFNVPYSTVKYMAIYVMEKYFCLMMYCSSLD